MLIRGKSKPAPFGSGLGRNRDSCDGGWGLVVFGGWSVALGLFVSLGALWGGIGDAVTVHFSALGVWAIGLCGIASLILRAFLSSASLRLIWAVGLFGAC